MNFTAPSTRQRALVLGGGGSTGHAWLIGVIAGMSEAGVDITAAELIIGTSAGSTSAAQITGTSPTKLLTDILTAWPAPQAGTGAPAAERPPSGSVAGLMEQTNAIMSTADDPTDLRRKLGAALIGASVDPSRQRWWRATVAARLPSQHWPQQPVLITAVNARTGEPVVFDRYSGIELTDAVAASCAAGFAFGIGEDLYIDGGYRGGAENADLAAGSARVLVLSPFSGRFRTPASWGMNLAAQVADLRSGGSDVKTIFPDARTEHLFGANAMDLSLRPAAARAGYDQGRAEAKRLTRWWA